MNTQITRRQTLVTMAGTLAAGILSRGKAMAQTNPPAAPAYRGTHEPKPLPFDPRTLKGMSEKLINSHHQNNYTGAVKRLNLIQQELGTLPKDAPPYRVGSLKREELIATNSMLLHELYFGNLGASGPPTGAILTAVTTAYGTRDQWEQEFRQTCLSLGGGSGWVILNYNPRIDGVHTYWSADHTNNLAAGMPLLVMDMYEHAYALDYGANAKGYVDAFFENVNWTEVNRRLERARATSSSGAPSPGTTPSGSTAP